MNVEYLAPNRNTGGLIRFYPATPMSTARLIAAIPGLTPPSVIWVHLLPGFSPVASRELALGMQSSDVGIIVNRTDPSFLWALSKRSWAGGKGHVSVLISEAKGGEW